MAQDETQALWREYAKSKDQAARDRLILTYAPLVKYVAGRLGSGLPAHVDENDLVSYGLLGLIGAIERFDPERDIKFETYAIARIKGSIIDELRALDWVPRSVRSRARDIERAIGELERKLHRAPTDEEISEKLGISTDELDESLSEIGRSSIAAQPSFRVDNVSGLQSVERWCASPRYFCSTNLCRTSMRSCVWKCAANCAGCTSCLALRWSM